MASTLTLKLCTKCDTEKPLEDFPEEKRNRDGRKSWCKKCSSKATRQWQINNPERAKELLKRTRARQYSLTVEEHRKLLAQGCAICDSVENLTVDHDHRTGLTRAVLCNHCNLGLGHFKDDPNKLQRAIEYLGRYTTLDSGKCPRAQRNS